jgi:hypothetical protein
VLWISLPCAVIARFARRRGWHGYRHRRAGARSIFSRSVSRASEIDKAEFEEKRKLLGR